MRPRLTMDLQPSYGVLCMYAQGGSYEIETGVPGAVSGVFVGAGS